MRTFSFWTLYSYGARGMAYQVHFKGNASIIKINFLKDAIELKVTMQATGRFCGRILYVKKNLDLASLNKV